MEKACMNVCRKDAKYAKVRKERRREVKSEPEISATLTRAALFQVLAQAFGYPAPGHVGEVSAAFGRVRGGESFGRAPRIAQLLRRARNAWRRADEDAAAVEYMRLFLGSGPVSLHETAYGDGRRIAGRPVELADINGFYHAFGFGVTTTDPDLPDHLGAELEFYSLLQLKDAWARDSHRRPLSAITREAARTFLARHLGRWVGALAESAAQYRAASPYFETVDLAAALVEMEMRRLRISTEPVLGRISGDAMQEEEFACPRAAGEASRAGEMFGS